MGGGGLGSVGLNRPHFTFWAALAAQQYVCPEVIETQGVPKPSKTPPKTQNTPRTLSWGGFERVWEVLERFGDGFGVCVLLYVTQ